MNHQSIRSDQRAPRTLWSGVSLILLALLMALALGGPLACCDTAWADEQDAAVEAVAAEDGAVLAEEAIEDDETPLSTFDVPHCWTHWLMVSGIVVTVLYGAVVVRRRLGLSQDIDDYQDNILGRTPKDAPRSVPQYRLNHS